MCILNFITIFFLSDNRKRGLAKHFRGLIVLGGYGNFTDAAVSWFRPTDQHNPSAWSFILAYGILCLSAVISVPCLSMSVHLWPHRYDTIHWYLAYETSALLTHSSDTRWNNGCCFFAKLVKLIFRAGDFRIMAATPKTSIIFLIFFQTVDLARKTYCGISCYLEPARCNGGAHPKMLPRISPEQSFDWWVKMR